MENENGTGGESVSRPIEQSFNLDNFDIIPAVSIQKGKIVQVKSNKYVPLTFRGKHPDTLDLIDVLYEAFEIILILDLDGIYRNKPAVDLYKKVSQLGDFWVDGGVRYSDTIIDLLITGAQNAVLGTKTLADLNELKEALELTENVVFGLDYNGQIISPNEMLRTRSPLEVLKEVLSYGVESCLFADLGRVDSKKSLETELIRTLAGTGANLYAGGGIKKDDMKMLLDAGALGAIIELSEVLENPGVFSLDPSLLDEIAPVVKNEEQDEIEEWDSATVTGSDTKTEINEDFDKNGDQEFA